MFKIGELKEKVKDSLLQIERDTCFSKALSQHDHALDAEEFYRGFLNLLYGWKLERCPTNFQGVDLIDLGSRIAVQVTNKDEAHKVHHSINGFVESCIPLGCDTLYVLMYTGKSDFPRTDFARSVGGKFEFDKDRHVIDHQDLLRIIGNGTFDFVQEVASYLDKCGLLRYANLDDSTFDLGIVGKIFDHLLLMAPRKASSPTAIKDSPNHPSLKRKLIINFDQNQRGRVSEMIVNTWDKKTIVGDYLRNLEDELVELDLREAIQSSYSQLLGGNSYDAPVHTSSIIDDLGISLLPVECRLNPSYVANAKAIVFYFFEFCFIGKKTDDEQSYQATLFD